MYVDVTSFTVKRVILADIRALVLAVAVWTRASTTCDPRTSIISAMRHHDLQSDSSRLRVTNKRRRAMVKGVLVGSAA